MTSDERALSDPSEGPDSALSIERQHIVRVLRQLDALQHREHTDIESALRDINAASVTSVPGALYAGITTISDSGVIATLAATHTHPELLDAAQRDTRQGPCVSAAWHHHTVHIDDLATDTRWPKYRAIALQRTPVRTIISFRLHGEGRSVAALNFYANTAGVFTDESIELGLVYAAHTTLAWNAMRREHQFRSALASRDVIGQAKGVIMERFNIDAVAAFNLLRRLSQSSNTKLTDIAEKLIANEHPTTHPAE